jgi:RNA polymerase sigma-70 factor (ECF subfamily)
MADRSEHETLVGAAASRDPAAIQSLLVRHLGELRAFVRLHAGALVRARESCTDLVQSVCREVLEDLPAFDYRGEAQFRAWLFKQALHKIVNRQRFWQAQRRDAARERAADASTDESLSACYQTLCTPSRNAMARETLEAIERAFDKLPESHREAILLQRVGGLSYAEIAEQMNKSEGAVRNLVYRGLAQLTALLGEAQAP